MTGANCIPIPTISLSDPTFLAPEVTKLLLTHSVQSLATYEVQVLTKPNT
jgi:hypothetical protein